VCDGTFAEWHSVPKDLGHPVPATVAPIGVDDAADDVRADRSDNDLLDAEDWQVGIAFVHGLAAGVVESLDTDATFGTETPLNLRVTVHDEALAEAGMTLAELAAAFDGDLRARPLSR
jgi:hypothetical protein